LDKNGDNEVTLYGSHDGTNQRWEFVYDKDKAAYQIKSVRDKDLVLAWNVAPNSRQVFAAPNQYKEEQYWILEKLGDYYNIKSKKDPNLVLDVEGSKTDNLTKIIVYEQHNGENQKFKLRKVPNISEVPTPPTGLQVTDIQSNSVTLRWNPSKSNVGIKRYDIYRDSNKVGVAFSTGFTDKGVKANTEYRYTVRAVDLNEGISDTSNEIKVKTKHSNAPGVYVTPEKSASSDIISIDWSPVQTAPYTYWAIHNWNQGGEAGGYAGFQQQTGFDEKGKRTLHFAIWDPIKSKQPIKDEYLSPNSKASRFGGEGTGLKIQTLYNWKNDKWYRMTMRSWQEDGHTKFGQWLRDGENKQWKLIGIMDFPVPNVAFNYGQMAFQEDWAGNGQDVREARLKNGYGRKLSDKQWISWDKQNVKGQDPSNYRWDGGATPEYVWFKAGGDSKSTIGTGKTFKLNQPLQPENGKLEFNIHTIGYENGIFNVSWILAEQSTPQFKVKIEIFNNANMTGEPIKIIDHIKPYQSQISQSIDLPENAYAKIIMTDLFDQSVEKNISIPNRIFNEGQIVTALDETKVLDKNGDNEVTLYGSHDGTNQRWEFVYDKDKAAYQIKSVRDKDLVLAWNVTPNSRQVFAAPNQYKEEQYWILEKLGDYYIIKSKKDPNLVLDVEGSKTDNLTKIIVYEQHNGENQKFKLRKI